jgi:hypothetical protein
VGNLLGKLNEGNSSLIVAQLHGEKLPAKFPEAGKFRVSGHLHNLAKPSHRVPEFPRIVFHSLSQHPVLAILCWSREFNYFLERKALFAVIRVLLIEEPVHSSR